MHLLVTFLFPLHLLLVFLERPNTAELFKNMTVSLTCVGCSLKCVIELWHLPQIVEIESVLSRLDGRVQSTEERIYFEQVLQRSVRRLNITLYGMYVIIYIAFSLVLSLLIIGDQRALLYAAWFPFDWHNSTKLYTLAFCYQTLCLYWEGPQGVANDIYPPLILCYVAGHTRLLSIRLSQMGYKEESTYRQELLRCIEDHKLLMRLYELIKQATGYVQLVQLLVCGAELCIVVCYVIFYVSDTVGLVYYVIFFGIICVQLFPSCYYASVLADESEHLPYAIFSSNWSSLPVKRRRDVLIFTQLTLRTMTVKAGGMFVLNLNAFFATVKMAYSLFAVVGRVHRRDTGPFRLVWICLRILAPTFFGASKRVARTYEVILHVLITILFPLHLIMGLWLRIEPEELFKNLTLSLTCIGCSLKNVLLLCNLGNIVEAESLLSQLDKRILNVDERMYFEQIMRRRARRLTGGIYLLYLFVYIALVPSIITTIQEGPQGLVNDVYPPLILCTASGHIRLLCIRFSKLGFQEVELEDSVLRQEMIDCCEDYKLLLRLHELVQQCIGYLQLVQIGICGLELCIVVCYTLYFVHDMVGLIYNVIFFAVICTQLFPSCYFSSILADELDRLPYAVFSGNWMSQSAKYRRDVLIFTQHTLRVKRIKAGGILELNLSTFFATVKMAYSLFAVVGQINLAQKV
ncbi:odorant receptor 33c [Scaptodrosophila lebanonensis]|uniref:Odorant receptor 33c n=1 Tax=Drosophila lebanonensis TaxID=7225 RepID=A0A6J2U592_DROLE|nr:odorant receptor 33c [Scaptodrosophila lebanonensis]